LLLTFSDLHIQMTSQPWLVTGAAGFLGSHVVEQLLARKIPVVGVDDLSTGKWQFLAPFADNQNFRFVCRDIRDEAGMTAICKKESPVAAVHLAALHFIPAAMRDPAVTVSLNVHGTQCVLSACRSAGVSRFWFASTADVYKPDTKAHQESGEVAPFNIYGLTKWMGEKLVHLESAGEPGRHFVIGRLFNLYGPHETNPHILPEIINQIRAGTTVLRLGNMTPMRDLVPVADAARAVIEMLEKSQPGVTTSNLGTGLSVTMQEVVEAIAELSGRRLKIETDPAKLRASERPHLQADVTRLRAMIGWSPHTDLRKGLLELLSYERVIEGVTA
jgi:UDP-glucose 4-epimerase